MVFPYFNFNELCLVIQVSCYPILQVRSEPRWYVRTAEPGSRLVRLPKAEATELAPEAVGASPPSAR